MFFLINLSRKLNGENITSTDIFSLASHVANKINHTESIPGFHLPSTRFGHKRYPRKTSSIRKLF